MEASLVTVQIRLASPKVISYTCTMDYAEPVGLDYQGVIDTVISGLSDIRKINF